MTLVGSARFIFAPSLLGAAAALVTLGAIVSFAGSQTAGLLNLIQSRGLLDIVGWVILTNCAHLILPVLMVRHMRVFWARFAARVAIFWGVCLSVLWCFVTVFPLPTPNPQVAS